ncbi:MAG: hypothetical protein ACLGSD_14950 [Acidobacteriota bacterium]
MGAVWNTVIGAGAGALITFFANQLLEYRKRRTPTIQYSAPRAVPVHIDGKIYAATRVTVENTSSKKIEDITVHLGSTYSPVQIQDIDHPQGLNPKIESDEHQTRISVPYLKGGEGLKLIAVAEGSGFVSDRIDISLSSPNEIRAKCTDTREPAFVRYGFFLSLGIVAFWVVCYYAGISYGRRSADQLPTQSAPQQGRFVPNTRERVVTAAAAAGLPEFARVYAEMPDPTYYEEADLACSFAAAGKKEDLEKYKSLLTISLNGDPLIASQSKANLLYCLGKLDLLARSGKDASTDFRRAIAADKETVRDRVASDPQTRSFIAAQGLL